MVLLGAAAAHASPIATLGPEAPTFAAPLRAGPFAYEVSCPNPGTAVGAKPHAIVLVATDHDERLTTYALQETKRYEYELRDAGFIAVAIERPRDGEHTYTEALTAVLDAVTAQPILQTPGASCRPSGQIGALGVGTVGGVAVLELARARETDGHRLDGVFVSYVDPDAADRVFGAFAVRTRLGALAIGRRDPRAIDIVLVETARACDLLASDDARCAHESDPAGARRRYADLHRRPAQVLIDFLTKDETTDREVAAAARAEVQVRDHRAVFSIPFLFGVVIPTSGHGAGIVGGRPELIASFTRDDDRGWRVGPGVGGYAELAYADGAWLGGTGLTAVYYRTGVNLALSAGAYVRGARGDETESSLGVVGSAFLGFRYPTSFHLDFPVGFRFDARHDERATSFAFSAQLDVAACSLVVAYLLFGGDSVK